MERDFLVDARPGFGPIPGDALDVVIGYDEVGAGKRAKEVYDLLNCTLGGECAFTNQMWKFDLFRIPKLREMAIKDAREADVIILSFGSCHRIWPHTKTWLAGWARDLEHGLAMVALFEGNNDLTRSTRDYLCRVAQAARIDFFAEPDGFRFSSSKTEPENCLRQRSLSILDAAANAVAGG